MSESVFRKADLATAEIIVPQTHKPVSEHMWAYFDFSTDPDFKDARQAFLPTAGAYDLLVSSNNGISYIPWHDALSVVPATYEPLYRPAGMITHVKAIPVSAVTSEVFAPGDVRLGKPLHARVSIARV